MSVVIELPPEIEAGLAAQAEARGIPLPDTCGTYSKSRRRWARPPLFLPLRAAAWRELVSGLPYTPPLSDAAISRESIYDARG